MRRSYCQDELCELQPGNSTNVSADGWKSRRRVTELEAQEIEIPPEMHVKIPQIDYHIYIYVWLEVLLSALKFCKSCKRRPVPLTYYNVVGELKRELGGIYLCKVSK